jgi:putative hemolysin
MSRFGAGFGSAIGALVGGAGAAAAYGVDPDIEDDVIYFRRSQEAFVVGFAGAVIGGVIGAAIGAGNSAPKQVGTSGVGLAAVDETQVAYLEFDRPMTNEAFFALVEELNTAPIEIVSIMPIDQTRVQAVFKPTDSSFEVPVGETKPIVMPDGSTFQVTTTSVGPYVEASPPVGMPNPADAYCVSKGGRIEVVDEPAGQRSYCVLPEGRFDAWALYRGEISVPEKKKLSTGAIVGLSLAGTAAAGGLVYAATRKKGRRS